MQVVDEHERLPPEHDGLEGVEDRRIERKISLVAERADVIRLELEMPRQVPVRADREIVLLAALHRCVVEIDFAVAVLDAVENRLILGALVQSGFQLAAIAVIANPLSAAFIHSPERSNWPASAGGIGSRFRYNF